MVAEHRQCVQDNVLEAVVKREMKEIVLNRHPALKDFENIVGSNEFSHTLQVADNSFELTPLVVKNVMTVKNA